MIMVCTLLPLWTYRCLQHDGVLVFLPRHYCEQFCYSVVCISIHLSLISCEFFLAFCFVSWSRTARFCSWEICKEFDGDIVKTSSLAFALSDSWSVFLWSAVMFTRPQPPRPRAHTWRPRMQPHFRSIYTGQLMYSEVIFSLHLKSVSVPTVSS